MTDTEYMIKPEKGKASLDTSDWPLLLKVRILFHSNLFVRITIEIPPKIGLKCLQFPVSKAYKNGVSDRLLPTINTISHFVFNLCFNCVFVAEL